MNFFKHENFVTHFIWKHCGKQHVLLVPCSSQLGVHRRLQFVCLCLSVCVCVCHRRLQRVCLCVCVCVCVCVILTCIVRSFITLNVASGIWKTV